MRYSSMNTCALDTVWWQGPWPDLFEAHWIQEFSDFSKTFKWPGRASQRSRAVNCRAVEKHDVNHVKHTVHNSHPWLWRLPFRSCIVRTRALAKLAAVRTGTANVCFLLCDWCRGQKDTVSLFVLHTWSFPGFKHTGYNFIFRFRAFSGKTVLLLIFYISLPTHLKIHPGLILYWTSSESRSFLLCLSGTHNSFRCMKCLWVPYSGDVLWPATASQWTESNRRT